jgi:hypothetical protein
MASRSVIWRGAWSWLGVAALAAIPLHVRGDDPPVTKSPTAKAVIERCCIGCHNAKLKTAELMLDSVDFAHIGDHPEVWEKVVRKLRTQEMPPPGMPRPDKATYASVAAELETGLDTAAAAKPNPGRIPVHRLNRAEYAAAGAIAPFTVRCGAIPSETA